MSLTVHPAEIIEQSTSPLVAADPEWPRKELGAVADVVNGFAFASKQFVTDGGMPLIRIRDLAATSTTVRYVGDFDQRYVVEPDDLLVGMDGDFNAARWRGPRALLNQRVCKLVPRPGCIDIDFLTILLPGYLRAIHDATSSTTVKHLSSKDLAAIPLPVPPLDVQQQIAAKVAAIAAKRRQAIHHLGTGAHALRTFRRAVLNSACAGRLTSAACTRPADDAADVVRAIAKVRRYAEGGRRAARHEPVIEQNDELPAGWCRTTIGSLVAVATGATPLRSRTDYYGGNVPWVTSGAVNAGVIVEPTDYITDLALRETNAKVFPKGTLLVAMYGEGQTRGRVAELGIAAATNQAVAALLFDDYNAALQPFLRLYFEHNYERMRRLAVGGVQANLSLALIRNMSIALPPLAEQREIVRRVNALNAAASEIADRLATTGLALRRSELAVAAKAFRGNLVSAC